MVHAIEAIKAAAMRRGFKTTMCALSLRYKTALHVRHELSVQVAVESLRSAFAADPAFLHAAEWRFRERTAEVVDVHHAGLDRIRGIRRGLQRFGEYVSGQAVRQAVRAAYRVFRIGKPRERCDR